MAYDFWYAIYLLISSSVTVDFRVKRSFEKMQGTVCAWVKMTALSIHLFYHTENMCKI